MVKQYSVNDFLNRFVNFLAVLIYVLLKSNFLLEQAPKAKLQSVKG